MASLRTTAAILVTLLMLTAGCLSPEDASTADPESPTGNETGGPQDGTGSPGAALEAGPNGSRQPDLPTDLVWAIGGTLQRVDADTGNLTELPLEGTLPDDGFITGMRWAPDDQLYVASATGSAIARIDPAEWTLEVLADAPPIERPIALDILPDGTIVVIDGGPSRSVGDGEAWAEGPAVLTVDPETGQANLLATDPRFTGPEQGDWFDIVAGPDGGIYLLTGTSNTTLVTPSDPSDDDGRGVLWYVNPDTGAHTPVATSPDWVFPDGLEVLEDGRLFVSDWAPEAPGTFTVDPSSGEVTPVATLPTASLLWGGEQLPDGRVVVTDAAGQPPNASSEDPGSGGLWTVDPDTGDTAFLVAKPGDGFAGHARVLPQAATEG